MQRLPDFLALDDEAKITATTIGRENQPLLKIENFMRDTQPMREYAIRTNNFVPADFYPGIRMLLPPEYLQALLMHLQKYLVELFQLDINKFDKGESFFAIVNRQPKDLQFLQKIPHFDAPNKDGIAAIHYLTNVENSGTSFYRHRSTGYEYVDNERRDVYASVIESEFRDKHQLLNGYINGDTDEFELIRSEPAVANTILVYRGSSLHSGNIHSEYNFDGNPATGRLTITTFAKFW